MTGLSRGSAMPVALIMSLLLAAAPSRADTPEGTPFSEVFAQLATRLVAVVVNISTTQAPASPTPKGGPEAQLPAPGAPLDEFFRDFFGEKGALGGTNPSLPRAASLGSG